MRPLPLQDQSRRSAAHRPRRHRSADAMSSMLRPADLAVSGLLATVFGARRRLLAGMLAQAAARESADLPLRPGVRAHDAQPKALLRQLRESGAQSAATEPGTNRDLRSMRHAVRATEPRHAEVLFEAMRATSERPPAATADCTEGMRLLWRIVCVEAPRRRVLFAPMRSASTPERSGGRHAGRRPKPPPFRRRMRAKFVGTTTRSAPRLARRAVFR